MDDRKLRVALYSHDAMGIGHIRRNLLIAESLAESFRPDLLMLAGAREAALFPSAPGMDWLVLPALKKDAAGQYQPRSLSLPLPQILRMRSAVLCAALAAFEPHVLIVDKLPRGVGNELDAALAWLRARGATRCVLGLRDILDESQGVRREWSAAGSHEAVRAYYDRVWVYGDPSVYDIVAECGLGPEIAKKARYSGYLGRAALRDAAQTGASDSASLAGLGLPGGRMILCVVGGGEDGAPLARAFAQARLPRNAFGVCVTGPFFPSAAGAFLRRCAASNPRLRVVEFIGAPDALLRRADRVVAMGGYNTTCELLVLGKPALIVPRVEPRREQLIRAQRLSALGLLDMIHPDALTPAAIGEWLRRAPAARPPESERIDLNGCDRLPELLRELLAGDRPSPAEPRVHDKEAQLAAP